MEYEVFYRTPGVMSMIIQADSPHEVIKKAKALAKSGWNTSMSFIEYFGSEEGEEIYGEEFDSLMECESCGNSIFSGEKAFGFEDATHCFPCGGLDESHKPFTA